MTLHMLKNDFQTKSFDVFLVTFFNHYRIKNIRGGLSQMELVEKVTFALTAVISEINFRIEAKIPFYYLSFLHNFKEWKPLLRY